MNFVFAEEKDLSWIVEVYNSTIPGRMATADTLPVSVDSKLNWFLAHHPRTRPLWIVYENNEKIGWASFEDFSPRPAYSGLAEISIYIHQNHRDKGYGKKILAQCMDLAPSLGIHSIMAKIFAHNAPSIQLFEQQGFVLWGTLPDVCVIDGWKASVKILGRRVG